MSYSNDELRALNANRFSILPPLKDQKLPERAIGTGRFYDPSGDYVARVVAYAPNDEVESVTLTAKGKAVGEAHLPNEIVGWLLGGTVKTVHTRDRGLTQQFQRDGSRYGRFQLRRNRDDQVNATWTGNVWFEGGGSPVKLLAWANAAKTEGGWAINVGVPQSGLPDEMPTF